MNRTVAQEPLRMEMQRARELLQAVLVSHLSTHQASVVGSLKIVNRTAVLERFQTAKPHVKETFLDALACHL